MTRRRDVDGGGEERCDLLLEVKEATEEERNRLFPDQPARRSHPAADLPPDGAHGAANGWRGATHAFKLFDLLRANQIPDLLDQPSPDPEDSG